MPFKYVFERNPIYIIHKRHRHENWESSNGLFTYIYMFVKIEIGLFLNIKLKLIWKQLVFWNFITFHQNCFKIFLQESLIYRNRILLYYIDMV